MNALDGTNNKEGYELWALVDHNIAWWYDSAFYKSNLLCVHKCPFQFYLLTKELTRHLKARVKFVGSIGS
jgi:hypothetical protein